MYLTHNLPTTTYCMVKEHLLKQFKCYKGLFYFLITKYIYSISIFMDVLKVA